MRVIFVSFASKRYRPTLTRIKREAKSSGFFDSIYAYNENDFDKSYWNLYHERYMEANSKFAFYMWKSYFCKKTLDKIDYGDILIYVDAGCSIHKEAKSRFSTYIQMLSENPILCFDHTNCSEVQYTKVQTLRFFGLENDNTFKASKQLQASVFFIKKTKVTERLVEEWYNACHFHYEILDHSLSENEDIKFISHRHDQSILSILLKKYNARILPQYEIYPKDGMWETMQDKPIWCTRNKETTLSFRERLRNIKKTSYFIFRS